MPRDRLIDMGFDVLAIGDTTIDAFIRLKDARVNCDINDQNCMLCMRFGDKIPFEFAEIVPAVGNSANAAAACARLGLNASVRVHVGDDQDGKTCIEAFRKNGVDTSLIVVEPGKKTNYHYVLWYESERTILIKHESFQYAFPELPESPAWIYLSSLGDGTGPYHEQIAGYLEEHAKSKLAFQPGTFQIKLGADALRHVYQRSDIIFCNKEEARIILKDETSDLKALLQKMQSLGPKVAVITDGREGAYAIDAAGQAFHLPMYPDPKPPVERTGAGDATASTTVAYLHKGLSLEESLMRGLINSAMVVQQIGAQKGLLSAADIEAWYAKRPADFKASAL